MRYSVSEMQLVNTALGNGDIEYEESSAIFRRMEAADHLRVGGWDDEVHLEVQRGDLSVSVQLSWKLES